MGTSHAAPQPKTVAWQKVLGSLRSPARNPATVLSATLTAALPLLPGLQGVYPITYAMAEGVRFIIDVDKRGLSFAVRKEAERLSDKFLIPSISDGLWNELERRADPRFVSGPYGTLAEIAFKKTLSSIMEKGAQALLETE
jgi:hypothetical protein